MLAAERGKNYFFDCPGAPPCGLPPDAPGLADGVLAGTLGGGLAAGVDAGEGELAGVVPDDMLLVALLAVVLDVPVLVAPEVPDAPDELPALIFRCNLSIASFSSGVTGYCSRQAL
jgi:hypothetical protein